MIPRKNDDRPLLDKRKTVENQSTGEHGGLGIASEDIAPPLCRWIDGRFNFSSPEAESEWHRHAYRQAVHPEDWHKGDPVDPQMLELVEAGAIGKTPPHFRGPDGQQRFSNYQTIEPAAVRAIRARHFGGKTLEEVSAAKMPGEDEAVRHMGAAKGRTRSAARPEVIEPASGKQQPKQNEPVLLADASAVPMMPEGYGTAGPRPMGGVEPWSPGGKIPGNNSPNSEVPPANDNMKPAASPEFGGPRVPDRQSTLNQSSPPGSMPASSPSAPSSLMERKDDIDRAVQSSIGEPHKSWAQRVMADPRSNNMAFVAGEATQLITFDLPHTIENYRNLPGMEAYRSPTPLDIELLRGAYTQQIVGQFPEKIRPQLQKELDARPKVLTSGPAGLSDLLQAMQQGEVVGFEVNGQPVTMGPNPYGAAGAPEIKRFNAIVGEEAKNLVEACEGVKDVKHTAGWGSGRPESWIQDVAKRSTNLGSRRIDVTVSFEINGQPCLFQINTADTAVENLFNAREWEAMTSAANTLRRNGADMRHFEAAFAQRLKDKVISQFNAFLMIGKPKKGERSIEEMRKLARDTLGLISCSEIELACKGNLILNKNPRP